MNMLQPFLGVSEDYESINGKLNGFAPAIKIQAYQYYFFVHGLNIRKNMGNVSLLPRITALQHEFDVK